MDERETIQKNPESVVALTDEINKLRAELAASHLVIEQMRSAILQFRAIRI